jgi:DNA-binding transcriptional LysR family regulator
MAIEINDLAAFVSVARASGFRDAARKSGVSPSGLSTAIRRHLDSGTLEPVLESWWQSFAGPFLYYPGRRHVPTPLRAFVDFIKRDSHIRMSG